MKLRKFDGEAFLLTRLFAQFFANRLKQVSGLIST